MSELTAEQRAELRDFICDRLGITPAKHHITVDYLLEAIEPVVAGWLDDAKAEVVPRATSRRWWAERIRERWCA